MIIIDFYYWNISEHKWKKAEKIFNDLPSAIRFCWSMKHRKMMLDGWRTYDPEDNQVLQRKVNIAKINGWNI